MKAVILAAGLGTRMNKLYPDTPKPLLPIQGKPLIQDQIKHLRTFGIKEFYINLHFLSKKIKNSLGNGSRFEVKINYSYEQKLLGTAGALNNFKDYLTETFIVLYGDVFTRLDIGRFLEFHRSKKSPCSLFIHETDHPEDSDLVKININHQITKIYLSPHQSNLATNLSSAAIYILEPIVLKYLMPGNSDFMKDLFPLLLKKGVNLYGYLSKEYSKDIGTPQRYQQVQTDINK